MLAIVSVSTLSRGYAGAADAIYTSTTTGTADWSATTLNSAKAGDVAEYVGNLSGGSTYTLNVNAIIGSLRSSSRGGSFTLASSGTNTLTLDGTGLSDTKQLFGVAGAASIINSPGTTATTRSLTLGSSTTGLTVNQVTDLYIGQSTTSNAALAIYGTIDNTSGSSTKLVFRGDSSNTSATITINSSIGTAGNAAVAVSNAGTGVVNVTLAGVLGTNVSSITQNSANSKLILGGNNSTGFAAGSNGVTVTSGSLLIGNAQALGTGNVLAVGGAGTLDLNNIDAAVAGLNDSAGVGGTVTNSGASAKTLTLGGGGTYSFSGVIGGRRS